MGDTGGGGGAGAIEDPLNPPDANVRDRRRADYADSGRFHAGACTYYRRPDDDSIGYVCFIIFSGMLEPKWLPIYFIELYLEALMAKSQQTRCSTKINQSTILLSRTHEHKTRIVDLA